MEKTTQADEGGSSSHGAIEGHNDNKSSSPRTTYDGREERTTNERSATSFSTSSSSHQEWGPDKNHQNDYQSNESNQEHEDNDDDDDLASRGTARQKTKELPKRFPLKLMTVLSNDEHSSIVSWAPNGSSFIIYKPDELVDKILPRYGFKLTKYASFTRKLHRWGFMKINSREGTAYFHSSFEKGNYALCSRMKCAGNDEESPIYSSNNFCPPPGGVRTTNHGVAGGGTARNRSRSSSIHPPPRPRHESAALGTSSVTAAAGRYQEQNQSRLQIGGIIRRNNQVDGDAIMMRAGNHGDSNDMILGATMPFSTSNKNNNNLVSSSFKNHQHTSKLLGGTGNHFLNSSIRSYHEHDDITAITRMLRMNQQQSRVESNYLFEQRVLMNQLKIEQTQLLLKLRQQNQQLYHATIQGQQEPVVHQQQQPRGPHY